MEQYIQNAVYVHALLGGVGLLTGMLSIAVKKGGRLHTRSGKIFSVSMIGSALISLVIANLPGHENIFLFLIGIFTIYLVLSGNRALTFKHKSQADLIDKGISSTMLLISIGMVLFGSYGIVEGLANSILFEFFGLIGLIMTFTDFKNYQKPGKVGLKSHIGRMVGALIASITAFMVAGLDFKNLFAWLTPTIIGTFYIVYWSRKSDKKKVVAHNL